MDVTETQVLVDQHLNGLEGIHAQTAANLIVMAGQLSIAQGYYFGKAAFEYVEKLEQVKVYSMSGELIATLNHHRAQDIIYKDDIRFPRGSQFRLVSVASPEITTRLRGLCKFLSEDLRQRGKAAADEFREIGSRRGGRVLTKEEVDHIIASYLV